MIAFLLLKCDRSEFETPGGVHRLDQPPNRIDITTEISGVSFAKAWDARIVGKFESRDVGFLSREHLIRNKSSTGRNKNRGDLDMLGPPLADELNHSATNTSIGCRARRNSAAALSTTTSPRAIRRCA